MSWKCKIRHVGCYEPRETRETGPLPLETTERPLAGSVLCAERAEGLVGALPKREAGAVRTATSAALNRAIWLSVATRQAARAISPNRRRRGTWKSSGYYHINFHPSSDIPR
jgi:hypothetical protein